MTTFTLTMLIIHALAIFLIIYHHVLFPIILSFLTRGKSETTDSTPIKETDLPSVSVLIPAYNEERWIAEKILNLSMMDYPAHKLFIYVLCDGCTDNTVQAAEACRTFPECRDVNLTIINHPENRGKVAIINDGMKHVHTDLVALTDVSALISIDALTLSAQALQDPQVGGVNSHYVLYEDDQADNTYWQYQSKIKQQESLLGSTLGAHGAFYIFRSCLFSELEPDTINDDFVLPMRIIKQGYRIKQEPNIVALELEKSDSSMDDARRKRISAGNAQQIFRLKSLLLPKYKHVAFLFASGKVLRVAIPFLMLTTYITNIFLLHLHPILLAEFILQTLFYLFMLAELRFGFCQTYSMINVLSYIFRGHVNGLVGSLHYLLYKAREPWKKV